MCGRTACTLEVVEMLRRFRARNFRRQRLFHPSFNQSPSSQQAALCAEPASDAVNGDSKATREIVSMEWGIENFHKRVINARAETLKAPRITMFSDSLRSRRCAVIVSGYYEWKKTANGKVPYYFRLPDDEPMTLAAVYTIDESVNENDPAYYQLCIVTTEACKEISEVHHRMPVILEKEIDLNIWLDYRFHEVPEALSVLRSYSMPIIHYTVSKYVNRVGNDGDKCIQKTEYGLDGEVDDGGKKRKRITDYFTPMVKKLKENE